MTFGTSTFGTSTFGGDAAAEPERAMLQLYRHVGNGAPPSLEFGEPAFSDGEPALWIGKSDGTQAEFRDRTYIDAAIASVAAGGGALEYLLSGVDGATTSFTLPAAAACGTVRLHRNGLRQLAGVDYTVSGSTLTTLFTAASGEELLVDVATPQHVEQVLTGMDGVKVLYLLDDVPIFGSTRLYRNGLRQAGGVDYSVDGDELTTVFVASSDDSLVVEYRL